MSQVIKQYRPCPFAATVFNRSICDSNHCDGTSDKCVHIERSQHGCNSHHDSAVPAGQTVASPDTAAATEVTSILDEARRIIYGDREKTYGAPDKNLQTIANFWSDFISNKYSMKLHLNVDDVCLLMVLVKVARLANDPSHKDSQVDLCGYAALMERVQKFHKQEKEKSDAQKS